MALNETSKEFISLKKLVGKAHTSNDKDLANEGLPSGVTMAAATVFKDAPPASPDSSSLYTITDSTVEYLRLSASFIPGTDTVNGRHAFALKLPDDYQANTSNPKAGTHPWVNGQTIHITSGTIQLVPPSFATNYEAKVYHTGSGETRIFLLDERDWNLDYFNGVYFQQDPPGTGDDSANPRYVDAYVYIGDFMSAGSGAGDITAVTAGTGLTGGATSGAATLAIDNDVVATISGSTFTGDVIAQTGLSGSLQKLADGTSYLVAGTNVTITSGSSGQITVSAADTNTLFTAGTGLNLDGTEFSIDNGVVATLTGSVFSGAVTMQNDLVVSGTLTVNELKTILVSSSIVFKSGSTKFGDSTDDLHQVTGSLHLKDTLTVTGSTKLDGPVTFGTGDVTFNGNTVFQQGLSGSLQKLADGTSYLVAGNNVSITSASSGQVTVGATPSGADTQIQFNNSGVFGSSSAFTFTGTEVELHAASPSLNLRRTNNNQESDIDFKGTGGVVGARLRFSGSASNDLVLSTFSGTSLKERLRIGSNLDDIVVEVTGTLRSTLGLSGSLTRLADGTSYLVAGDNITIATASNGQVTITSTDTDTLFTAGDGLDLTSTTFSLDLKASSGLKIDATELAVEPADFAGAGLEDDGSDNLRISAAAAGTGLKGGGGTALSVDDSVFASLSGSQFSGNVGVTGSIGSTTTITSPAFSGSLTHLTDGTSYLLAGAGIAITTGSSGQITITNDGTVGDVTSVTAGVGLSGGGTSGDLTLTLDVSELSALGTTAETSDFVVIEDATDNSTKKVLVSNLLASAGDITEVTAGTGLTGGGATGSVTLAVDDGIFAALTGSTFSGNVVAQTGLSGSLQQLADGTSYLVAGSGISIASGSNGQITITGNTGDITSVVAGAGLAGGATSGDATLTIDNNVVATISGSTFSGDVIAQAGLSGSLQNLADGTSYIKAGNGNVTIVTASNGAITISTVDTNTVFTAGDGLDLTSTEFSLDLKASSGLKIDSTELAVEPADFAGAGLEDDGSDNLRIATSAAGNGLTGGGGSALAIDNSVVATLTGSVFSGAVTMMDDLIVSGTLTALEIHTMVVSSSIIHRSGSTKFGDTADDTHQFSGSLYLRNDLVVTGSSVFNGISTFGTGSAVFNSTATFNDTISGSIHHTAGGLSYLVAGSNVTISSASNGQVTISATGGGGGTTTIGNAEDGDYTDGLYTDFTSSTNIGVAVDRFNEVLKALAPTPAPTLDDIDVNQDGTDVQLSFGASNDQSSASPAYVSVGTAAGQSAVDVNGTYQTATTGNNLRAAVFQGSTDIIGDLNEDVLANTYSNGKTNYPANSFGDADAGTLQLEVNGSVIHSIDLSTAVGAGGSGEGTGTEVNADGSGFINLSNDITGTFENGNSFASFKHRTGQFKVAAASQRNGWNYARVNHAKSGGTVSTNYIEWVNDNNSDALSVAGTGVTFTGIGNRYLSGVEYFVSGTVAYKARVSNAYKYVYDTNNIEFGVSLGGDRSSASLTLADQAKPTINTGAGEDHTKVLHLTASNTLTANYMVGGSVTCDIDSLTHPLKGNLVDAGSATANNILMYNIAGNSTNLSETFNSETYRLVSGSYGSQGDVTDASNAWDSTIHMSASNGAHSDGLLFYLGALRGPTRGGNSGNFQYSNGPSMDNPDYGSESGIRTFYRKFKNTTGKSVDNLAFVTVGSSSTTLVPENSVLSTNRCKIFFKHPGGTQWLDAATGFTYHNTGNRSGGAASASGAQDTSLSSATNYITFGSGSIPNNEHVVMKVEADASWSGDLGTFTVTFGAAGARNAAPNLTQIDANTNGTDASLSFGSSLALAGYSNVTAAGGIGAVDANGDYDAAGARIAVLNGTTDVTGDLNENVSASGNNYSANSFGGGNAHLGELKLELNGSVVHTFNLENNFAANTDTSGTGGTGFNVSAADVTRDGNQIPSWDRRFRTATYKVVAADQRKGYNYARVIHTVTGSDFASSYVEWVNDTDGVGQAVSLNTATMVNFRSDTTYSQSGIKYFISPKADLVVTGTNVYKFVYSELSDAIRFPTTTNCSVISTITSGSGVVNGSLASSQMPLPNLDTSVADAYNRDIFVTGTLSFSQASSVPGATSYTMAASARIHHPLKGNTTSNTVTSPTLLVFNSTDNSTNLSEEFNGEAKRLISGSYANQAAVVSGGNAWNSSTSMNGADAGHNTGLAVYNGNLVAPANTGNSGDFRNTADGGSLASPDANPNYSNVTNSTRDYTRWIRNTSGGSKTDFVLSLSGSGTIVSAGTNLASSDKLEVHVKIPRTDAGFETGWMDISAPFETGKNGDNAGALVGSLDSSLNSHVTGTFGTQSVGANEYILVRVIADKTWTGNISFLTLKWV